MSPNVEKMKRLEELLKHHDWFFQYSDDHGVWSRGNERLKDISRMLDELKRDGFEKDALELFRKYKPENY